MANSRIPVEELERNGLNLPERANNVSFRGSRYVSRPLSTSDIPQNGESVGTELSSVSMANPDPSLTDCLHTPYRSMPPFKDTEILHSLVSASNLTVIPTVHAQFDGSFFNARADWTCYRRNYFGVSCSFGISSETVEPLFVLDDTGIQHEIDYFAMSLSALVDGSGESIELVQHILKRGGSPKGPPDHIIIQPSSITDPALATKDPPLENVTARFGRLQFKKATACNGKRKASQQYFSVVVELLAFDKVLRSPFKIAARMSVPIIVRGRSPANYRDVDGHRRDQPMSILVPVPVVVSGHSYAYDQYSTYESIQKKVLVSQYLKLQAPELESSKTSIGQASSEHQSFATQVDVSFTRFSKAYLDLLEDEAYSSTSSISDLFSRSRPSSVSSIAGLPDTAHQLVILILGDNGVRALCTDGLAKIDTERFARNLKRLLSIYSTDLLQETIQELEVLAARSVKAYARRTAYLICKAVEPNASKKASEMKAFLDKNTEKDLVIKAYLQGYPPSTFPNSDYQESKAPEFEGQLSDSEDSASLGGKQSDDDLALPAIEQIKDFMINSDAFETMREGLMGFVIPIIVASQLSIIQAEVSMKRAIYCNDLQLRKRRKLPASVNLKNLQDLCSITISKCTKFPLGLQDPLVLQLSDLENISNEAVKILSQLECFNDRKHSQILQTIRSLPATIEEETRRELTKKLQERYEYQRHQPKAELLLRQTHDIEVISKSDSVKPREDPADIEKEHVTTKLYQNELSASIQDLRTFLEHSLVTSEHQGSARKLTFLRRLLDLARVRMSIMQQMAIQRWRKAKGILRPRLQSGHIRIEWTCIWGDFKKDNLEAINTLATLLQCPTDSITSDSVQGHTVRSSLARSNTSLPGRPSDGQAASTSQHNSSTPQIATQSGRESLVQLPEKYLELCINTGEYETDLAEIWISNHESPIMNDGQLFQQIRDKYNKHRGFLKTHALHLFKPVGIHFVQFCLEDGILGILKSPMSIPPEETIKARQWEFCSCPCPLKDLPPIPTNVFLHHFYSTRTHPRSTWLNRLPKKLHQSIHQNPDSDTLHVGLQAHGWGVQIIEGPNGMAVFWLTVAIVILSAVAAISWASTRNDVQGAFGIAAFLVASTSALLFAFFQFFPVQPLSNP